MIIAAIEPVSVEEFLAVFPARRRGVFVLDGGDWTLMGAEPAEELRASRTHVTLNGRELPKDTDPLHVLRDLLSKQSSRESAATRRRTTIETTLTSIPFRAGVVGYVGYEYGQRLERLPCIPRPSIGMPDLAFNVHRWVIATHRQTHQTWLSAIDDETFHDIHERIRERARSEPPSRSTSSSNPSSASRAASTSSAIATTLSRDEYLARIAIAKKHIEEGDAFEICLTNRMSTPFSRDSAIDLFHQLRRANPAPYAAFLDLEEGVIVSSSPEKFLSFDPKTRVAESRPIKGTRPRGATPEEDEALARDLASSEKDRAENAMIVDLVRNDLGKVCAFGTVEVPSIYAVERYATVHQLVSTIRGTLSDDGDDGKDSIDLLTACFPPGSMTGAPKIEAMSILEHLEPVERGVYSGVLGFIDIDGSMDLSVVIRTAVITNDNVATFSVGGAIVADSDPATEHEETMHKARALIDALAAVAAAAPLAEAGE